MTATGPTLSERLRVAIALHINTSQSTDATVNLRRTSMEAAVAIDAQAALVKELAEALEEAAKIADKAHEEIQNVGVAGPYVASQIAAKIRALIAALTKYEAQP